MQAREYSPTELAWLAGWLEGEGTFYAYQHASGFKIGVQATSTDEDTIVRVLELAGGSMRGPIAPEKPHWSPKWVWGVHGRDTATALMRSVRPYMLSRRQAQIDVALAMEAATPRRAPAEHGKKGLYNRGCRCELCTAANRESHREYVQRRRAKEAADGQVSTFR